MSVYATPRSPYWQYDFQFKGRRFHGSTGTQSKRAAEAFERRLRADAASGRLDDIGELTLNQAAGKWWAEVGRHRQDAVDVERRIDKLLELMGKDTRLRAITTGVVATAIERRRGQRYARSPKKDAKTYALSNATVNRDVVETLRPVLAHAADMQADGGRGGALPTINWKKLRLVEPPEVVRTYSAAEQAAWQAACTPTPRFALRLLLTYGLRFGELFFDPATAYDPEGRRLIWFTGRKRNIPHVLPLREDDAREIAARVGRAVAAGLPSIWYLERGKRLIPISYAGLEARLSRAADKAGIQGGRRIHGARHHAGSAMVKESGNIALAKALLGHRNIRSTMRYVHTAEDDLRAALTAKSRNSPEPETRDDDEAVTDKAVEG